MTGENASHAIELRAISCARDSARLQNIDLAVPVQRLVALRGTAGEGKELLLKIAGLLEVPDEGDVIVDGTSARDLNEADRAEIRRRHFAYLFAAPFLLPGFTVIENVVMPMFKVLDTGPTEARLRADELLSFVGAAALEAEPAVNLSPFDQRRVALARALATAPAVLLAEDPSDEFTPGQLRDYTALLRTSSARWGTTTLVAVPGNWHATQGEIVYDVADGKVVQAAQELPRG
jgi:lipoprotein-releasing system ATP-binding protein